MSTNKNNYQNMFNKSKTRPRPPLQALVSGAKTHENVRSSTDSHGLFLKFNIKMFLRDCSLRVFFEELRIKIFLTLETDANKWAPRKGLEKELCLGGIKPFKIMIFIHSSAVLQEVDTEQNGTQWLENYSLKVFEKATTEKWNQRRKLCSWSPLS